MSDQARWTKADGTVQTGPAEAMMRAYWDAGQDGKLEPIRETSEWGRLIVDPAKALEIAEKVAKMRKLGFSIPATMYSPGTRMVQTGVNEYRRRHAEWADRPLFSDVAAEVRDRIKAEDRRDMLVNLSDLRMSNDGQFYRKSQPGKMSLPLELSALERLLSYATEVMPQSKRLFPLLDPRVRAKVWNSQVAKLTEDTWVKLGIRRDENREWSIYRVVSPKYSAHAGADVILDALISATQNQQLRGTVSYDPTTTIVAFDAAVTADPIKLDPVVGDLFRTGLRGITADGAQYGSISINPFVGRIACINCTMIDSYAPGLRMIHRGDLPGLIPGIRGVAAETAKAVRLFADDWKLLRSTPATDRHALAALGLLQKEREKAISVPDVLTVLTGQRGRNLPSAEALSAAYDAEPGESLADLMNSITRAAHEGLLSDLQRWQAEREAGALIPVMATAIRTRQGVTA